MFGDLTRKQALYGLITVLFLVLLYKNYQSDLASARALESVECHKEVALPHVSDANRLMIESVISDYNDKRVTNESNCSRIFSSVKLGVAKGAVSGLIIGADPAQIIAGGMFTGVLSGALKSYSLLYEAPKYVRSTKT